MPLSGQLADLADACGVATSYLDYLDRPVDVGDDAVRRVLAAMGVAASTGAEARASLQRLRNEAEAELVAPSLVVRSDRSEVVRHRLGVGARATVVTEDGNEIALETGDSVVAVPGGLPLGYHRLLLHRGAREAESALIIVPPACPRPRGRGWGWMVQLYQARSEASWGMGDLADLGTLAADAGQRGASFVLVNPLHAANPTAPQENSPYYPSSRRFRSPLYLRVEDLAEFGAADADTRQRVAALAAHARDASTDRIDRDTIAAAKVSALRLLFAVEMGEQRRAAFASFVEQRGGALADFATFCALAERHGTPWQQWPARLRDPRDASVREARSERAHEAEFHAWLQWLCDEQLEAAQRGATAAGMDLGVIHDLAVGVDPGGADAWALQADLTFGATIGAPPDGFNQRGQDWRLPPLLPQRLRTTAYRPFADMVRSVLRASGGIRIDHVMGLWRLWWVPEGCDASAGSYVRYPADALLGVLALEAERAGAVVVGEDLGTVEKGVRDQMSARGVLSSRVVWFERVDDDPAGPRLPAADYPAAALTSITTHDLPTAAGWWADEDVRTQTELGLYGDHTTPAEQARRKEAERRELAALLVAEGLLDAVPDGPVTDYLASRQLVLALHRFLARTPSALVATGLADALGDRRQPNMPATSDEYPNWRLPLARTTSDGRTEAVRLEQILSDELVAAVAGILNSRGR